jgi:hypothetical protein
MWRKNEMVRGKTINIYLPDGNPKGIKICEIPNSIIKTIMIPRNLLKDISGADDLNKVGLYFLFSEKDEFSQFKTYIGEAENLLIRLKQHDAKRDDWNYAICFLSGKDNLNKAHVKFLESYCYSLAQKLKRTTIQNNCSPTKSNLTKSDEDFSLSFFDEIKIILGVLGYPIFDEIKKAVKEEEVFYCKGKNAIAKGNLTEEGFVVYLGSKSNLEEAPSAGSWLENTRKRLLEQGILKKEENILVFTKDFSFNSPSAAAGVVLGRRANGWTEWKNSEGKTLDELKRKYVEED